MNWNQFKCSLCYHPCTLSLLQPLVPDHFCGKGGTPARARTRYPATPPPPAPGPKQGTLSPGQDQDMAPPGRKCPGQDMPRVVCLLRFHAELYCHLGFRAAVLAFPSSNTIFYKCFNPFLQKHRKKSITIQRKGSKLHVRLGLTTLRESNPLLIHEGENRSTLHRVGPK